MWHTPQKPGAWLDEAFDETLLDHMAKGDIKAMAAHFDSHRIAAAGAMEGTTATIVDRVPIYASPIDTVFACFNL